jgi:hypothetical protein
VFPDAPGNTRLDMYQICLVCKINYLIGSQGSGKRDGSQNSFECQELQLVEYHLDHIQGILFGLVGFERTGMA